MPGVGEDGQRAGEDPADELDGEHRQVDRQREAHPAAAVAAALLERRAPLGVPVTEAVDMSHGPSLEPPPRVRREPARGLAEAAPLPSAAAAAAISAPNPSRSPYSLTCIREITSRWISAVPSNSW